MVDSKDVCSEVLVLEPPGISLLGASEGLTGSCMAQGFVYAVDCEGRTLQGWPLQMGEVQAQVAVGDINGDGALEVVATDMHGNVAALSADGTELWERHIKSSITQVAPAHIILPVQAVSLLHAELISLSESRTSGLVPGKA